MDESSQIGYLVPLDHKLDDDISIPKIPLSRGRNVVGRDNVPVTDKRLSRKHLTINATVDGSAHVLVEGSNPIVVRSGNQRKKLLSQERLTIKHGDVIELIPGHHFFKYVASSCVEKTTPPNKRKRNSNEYIKLSEGETLDQKRMRQVSKEKAFARKLQAELDDDSVEQESSIEAIRDFNISNVKLPLTFRLLRVQGLPAWANTSSVSIGDVIQGDVLVAVLSNYMVDIDWLNSACPSLKKVPHVLVLHGEGDGTLEYMKRNKPANWILHKPPLPISYGTHHSKAMLLVYPRGVRIIVHTANLISVDWNNKSQGLWMQDFPWKDQNNSSEGCGFESDLIDYLSALKWPEFTVNLPTLGNIRINSSFFKKFDYSNAGVRLIASVPGYHTGPNVKKWGHMKLRTILNECIFDKEFQKSPLVYQMIIQNFGQCFNGGAGATMRSKGSAHVSSAKPCGTRSITFSSLGSLDEKWMAELASSMSSGVSEDKTPLGLGEPLIVFPTVEDVRCSLEGYAAGSAIPSPQKNVEKDFLKKYWAKWKANHSGRCRAMPHIKTFTRYKGQNLAWLLLTSANLSKAAWGVLQKNNSQLMIRSYELGVLFLPSSIKHGCDFSCTDNGNLLEDKCESFGSSNAKRTKLVTLAWKGSRNTNSTEVIQLPVPYELPPQPYSSEDVPWSWDRGYHKKDVYGQVWPR